VVGLRFGLDVGFGSRVLPRLVIVVEWGVSLGLGRRVVGRHLSLVAVFLEDGILAPLRLRMVGLALSSQGVGVSLAAPPDLVYRPQLDWV
jgi:hypothetical protein